jgi:hypothetical protein
MQSDKVSDSVEPLACSIPETKRITGESRSKIYQLLADGTYSAVKAGKKTLILYPSIKRRFAALPRAAFKAQPPKPLPRALPRAPRAGLAVIGRPDRRRRRLRPRRSAGRHVPGRLFADIGSSNNPRRFALGIPRRTISRREPGEEQRVRPEADAGSSGGNSGCSCPTCALFRNTAPSPMMFLPVTAAVFLNVTLRIDMPAKAGMFKRNATTRLLCSRAVRRAAHRCFRFTSSPAPAAAGDGAGGIFHGVAAPCLV